MTRSKVKKGTRKSPAERLVKLFLNSRTIPPEDMDAIRRWLVDENRTDEKADVFVRQFAANIAYSKRPRESSRLWLQFAQRIRVKNEG